MRRHGWGPALATKENERLVQFSDAIMAVTITLLTLDIRLPDLDVPRNSEQLLAALVAMGPHLFAYVLSFFVIGSFWIAHRRKFDAITGSHPSIIWLNFLFLLLLGLLPFATDVLAEDGGLVGTVLYASLVAVVSFLLVLISLIAERRGLLADEGEHLMRERMLWPSLATSGVFATSIPLAFLETTTAQIYWFVAFPLNAWLWRRWRRARDASSAQS